MSAAAIRAFGVVTLLFETLILFAMVGHRAGLSGAPLTATIISSVVICVFCSCVGFGLLFLRKWAALILTIALIGLPIRMAIAAWQDQDPAVAYMMLVAVMVVLVPIIIIVRSWPLLSWRGKWLL